MHRKLFEKSNQTYTQYFIISLNNDIAPFCPNYEDIDADTIFRILDISPKIREFVLKCRLIMDISKESDLSKVLIICQKNNNTTIL